MLKNIFGKDKNICLLEKGDCFYERFNQNK